MAHEKIEAIANHLLPNRVADVDDAIEAIQEEGVSIDLLYPVKIGTSVVDMAARDVVFQRLRGHFSEEEWMLKRACVTEYAGQAAVSLNPPARLFEVITISHEPNHGIAEAA